MKRRQTRDPNKYSIDWDDNQMISDAQYAANMRRRLNHSRKQLKHKSVTKQLRASDKAERIAVYALNNGGNFPTIREHDVAVRRRLRGGARPQLFDAEQAA
ncbi:hypothetical protein [uncultured Paraglaciecola sp.]|uniref:hypothetical protein n=1 Tax=uncultured Paraglaciecola sp. TaxID=1765024 RepID=UPI00261A5FEA|nr:hypothetical protein [uncultured Paraglaciecola sp.]